MIARQPYRRPVLALVVCFTLGTAACTSNTNTGGNCNAQGGSNKVTCIVEPTTPVGPTPSVVTTTPPQPSSSGSLADVPQSPAGRLDAGGLTYKGRTYSQSFQIAVPGLTNEVSYSYSLGGQWSQIDLYIASTEVNGVQMPVSLSLDGQPAGSYYLAPGAPYADALTIKGVQTLTISFQNGVGISSQTVQIAGNLFAE
jgi:hypothetical protein